MSAAAAALYTYLGAILEPLVSSGHLEEPIA